MRRSLLVVTAVAFFVVPATAQAADGDIIVQRQPGLDGKERRELRADAGVKLVSELGVERTELVEPKDGDVAEAVAELRADDDVVYAAPDRRMHATSFSWSPSWWTLWGLEDPLDDTDIDAFAAWQRSLGTGVTVAVVDTGIKADHPELTSQIAANAGEQPENGIDDDGNGYIDDVAGWDFVGPRDNDPQDGNGHGTHVAGTIAAANTGTGAPVIGVAPEAKILPLRALDDSGGGWTSDIADAFEYAGDLGVKIVNASLGGDDDPFLNGVIADHPETLYVVAAGNDGKDDDVPSEASYPCAAPEDNLLCVGASDTHDERATFDPHGSSNYGATTVDLFAPGRSIRSTTISGTGYGYLSGTSMATPHAAGAAALALAANPAAATWELKQALMTTVDTKEALAGLSVTGGRLNADAAVVAINGPLPTPTPIATPTVTSAPTPTATPTPSAPAATPTPTPVTPTPATPTPVTPTPVTPVVTPAPTVTQPIYLFDVRVGGSLLTKRSKLRVRFELTKATTVRFSIARSGSKKALSSWTTKGRSGANSVTIMRRLPTGRTLKPGSYKLSVSLSATATNSRSIRVR